MNLPQAIICSHSDRQHLADTLAKKYKLPLFDETQGQLFSGLSLVLGERIQLHNPDIGAPLEIDFDTPTLLSRLRAGSRQPLGRACGLHKTKGISILDCTAGMGQDMLTMAAMSAKVTALERNPFIHLLLNDAFSQEYDKQIILNALSNCQPPINADACDYLLSHEKAEWDVIYLDPMFSGYKRKALPKKSMQIFADLCGPDQDVDNLFKLALSKCKRRVVVKRGPQAPLLAGIRPDHQIKGKSLRFDVYMAEN